MKSVAEIALALRARAKNLEVTQEALGQSAGVSRRTLTHVLGGENDFKLSTLMAVADRLGLEVALVPKGAAQGLPGAEVLSTSTPSAIKTRVGQARHRFATVRRTPTSK
ncbi:hypothetical protein PTE30175_05181 [Pandoraea terrae]|uniref:HTH cro/C1-type domain-containing protein n=1 Tax=Pandoraea terrae TaxID=1537710 RepID=A0A5E4ZD23_9BURK|nr:helix-turn-helix domain-containing protein [Pandoraea terrae]VVE58083.1 hypothetical protein PTE30175_05181 [Pandoraea terrae]